MTAFDRACKLTLFRQPAGFIGANPSWFEELGNGVEISDVRQVAFRIEKNLAKEPNTAEVTIYNLAERSRNELDYLPLRVHIEAGHAGTSRLLFVGDLRPGSGSTLEGTEWVTKLRLGDGTRAFTEARINRSYKPGTPLRAILRDAARSLGLSLPSAIDRAPEFTAQIASGEGLTGYASDELTRLLAAYGYTWSIQNGRLQVLRDEQGLVGEVRVISQTTGMLGVPSIKTPAPRSGKSKKKGKIPSLSIRHILDGSFMPGQLIVPQSLNIDGTYKISTVKHEGNLQDWTTEIEARQV